MKEVRDRIAPSPTGFAHVGTAYTSLFNLAFARKHSGKFILRLEDTDQKRNIKEAEEKIYKGLHWLGIDWDEGPDVGGEFGPYRQSERVELYNPFIETLIKNGKAYEEEGAVFLKVEKDDIKWTDLVRGEVTFPADQMKDFIIRKSDGFPTYHFAVVIDDHLMKISHVIRAEDHISNTPKQIQIYKALDFEIPEFAHTPLLRNKDKSKMSKRKNNIEIGWYKEEGFLPDAMVNYFSLLGWSHPEEKEIFSREEFFDKFSLERVRKSAPIFDVEKLRWMNSEYIKNSVNEKLADLIFEFFNEKYDKNVVLKAVPLVKERISTLKEFESIAGFYFEDRDPIRITDNHEHHIAIATEVLENIPTEEWKLSNINQKLSNAIEENEFKTGNFYMDLRGTLAGSKVTPPINESIEILGKENTIRKLHIASDKIE